jgi:hypothetical protein
VAYGTTDRLTGMVLLDARNRVLPAPRLAPPFRPSPDAPVVQSPAF